MWYLAAFVAGCAVGTASTVILAQLYARATVSPEEPEDTAPEADPQPTPTTDQLASTYGTLLRYRELVDEDGNLRRH